MELGLFLDCCDQGKPQNTVPNIRSILNVQNAEACGGSQNLKLIQVSQEYEKNKLRGFSPQTNYTD
jgi:hypothetical protein